MAKTAAKPRKKSTDKDDISSVLYDASGIYLSAY